MRKVSLCVFLSLLLVAGCSNPLAGTEEVTEVTEVPVPDTVSDISQSITYEDMTVTYTVADTEALAPASDASITVYENRESFNSASIEIRYMPNYARFASDVSDVYMKGLTGGYTLVVRDNGIGADACYKILNSVQEGAT